MSRLVSNIRLRHNHSEIDENWAKLDDENECLNIMMDELEATRRQIIDSMEERHKIFQNEMEKSQKEISKNLEESEKLRAENQAALDDLLDML